MSAGFNKYGLLFIMLLSVTSYFLVKKYVTVHEKHPAYATMKKASALAADWFKQIAILKKERAIVADNLSQIPFKEMIGNDYTVITSTLGSLEAKELSAQPAFAALMVSLLLKADMDSTKKAGVLLTGSFPALTVCTFAALQTLHIPAIVFSSLSASCYGANQPLATWLDMETQLQRFGNLQYKTYCVSIGSENDNGSGLTDEGRQLIYTAAERNERDLYIPASLQESIEYKMEVLLRENVQLLINIGGNQAAVGGCSHASTIPFGLNFKVQTCSDKNRGLIFRMAEKGVPFIHLLHIKDLARRYGVSPSAGDEQNGDSVYFSIKTEPLYMILAVLVISFLLVMYKMKKEIIKRKQY